MSQKTLLYYKCRNCDTNITANTPANRYQIQKLIQNTVRVPSSEYLMNKASLNVVSTGKEVCWNQQSDRPFPSVQKATIPTGMFTSMNGKHTSHTSSRPGCQTPGGVGCDIKHNSYDRYLNRLKGKKILKRGIIPPEFALPTIPFNRAYPVYGGKLVKTSIVAGCKCSPYGVDETILYKTNENALQNAMSSFTPGAYCELKERKEKKIYETNDTDDDLIISENTLNVFFLPNVY
jgi:hypothetical protein